MRAVPVIAAYALRESLRRRVFLIVLLLTLALGVLYAVGTWQAFKATSDLTGAQDTVDGDALAGATLLGLANFTTLFLGAVLAVFLTLSAVRGDAERGLLQPLVVRPVGRPALLLGRFVAAAAVCAGYVAAVYAGAVIVTGTVGGWWPDRIVAPGAGLAGAVVVIVALSLLGSVFLTATANGIAIFMVFGAGLSAGLLGQIGDALSSDTLSRIADVASWGLPFEALYQAGLGQLTADTGGVTGFALSLGPFGGARSGGPLLVPWSIAYVCLVGALATWAFARRDL